MITQCFNLLLQSITWVFSFWDKLAGYFNLKSLLFGFFVVFSIHRILLRPILATAGSDKTSKVLSNKSKNNEV